MEHHNVCDRCGNYWQTVNRARLCPACRHDSIWDFQRERPAREHAARLRDPHESVTPKGAA